jgi:hypothetical protein
MFRAVQLNELGLRQACVGEIDAVCKAFECAVDLATFILSLAGAAESVARWCNCAAMRELLAQ